MKTRLLTLMILWACSMLRAQTVQWGPLTEDGNWIGALEVFRPNPDSYIMLMGNKLGGAYRRHKKFYLQAFDQALAPSRTAELKPAFGKKKLKLERVFQSGNQLFVFASQNGASKGKRVLYLQKLNTKSLNLEGTATKIFDFYNGSPYQSSGLQVRFSPDSSNIAICGDWFGINTKNRSCPLAVFDKNMKLKWSKTVTIPSADDGFCIDDFLVDADGDVFLLGKEPDKVIPVTLWAKLPYRYMVIGCTNKLSKIKRYDIDDEEKEITSMLLRTSPDNQVWCAGLYSNKKGRYSVGGCIFANIDKKEGAITQRKISEFPLELLKAETTERKQERIEKRESKGSDQEMVYYEMRDLVPRQDGSMVLLAEQFLEDERVVSEGNGRGYTVVTYYYYDVIALGLGPEGEIKWHAKIPKRQWTTNDFGVNSSYGTVITPDSIHLIYNDCEANLSPDRQGDYENFVFSDYAGIATIATIDLNGNLSRRILYRDSIVTGYARPRSGVQVSENQFLLYAPKVRRGQIGLITLE